MGLRRKKKMASVDVAYDSDTVRLSDEEAHRNVTYKVPGNLHQLFTVYRFQMERYANDRTYLGGIIAVLLVPIITAIIFTGLDQIQLEIPINETTLPSLMLCLMPIFIITMVNRYFSGILSEDFSGKTGFINLTLPMRRSVNLFGKYLAGMTMCVITYVILYLLVYGFCMNKYGSVPVDIWGSLAVAVCVLFCYGAFEMLLNAVFKKQAKKMDLILFFVIPGLFLLLTYKGIASLDTLQYVFPVGDSVLAALGNGFGGFSLLTLGGLALSMPAITASAADMCLLSIAWCILFLGGALYFYSRREM